MLSYTNTGSLSRHYLHRLWPCVNPTLNSVLSPMHMPLPVLLFLVHTHVCKGTNTSCLLVTQGEASLAGLSLITLVSWPISYQYSLYTWYTVELYYWSPVYNGQKVTIRKWESYHWDSA